MREVVNMFWIKKKLKDPPKTIESELKKLLDILDQIQKITEKWR